MSDGVFTLPNAETMLEGLKKVSNNDHLCQKFYPNLTKHAGTEKVPMGVVMLITLALHDYLKGMPAQMWAVMNLHVDGWIDAMIPDESLAAEAKDLWAQAQQAA